MKKRYKFYNKISL